MHLGGGEGLSGMIEMQRSTEIKDSTSCPDPCGEKTSHGDVVSDSVDCARPILSVAYGVVRKGVLLRKA